LLIGVFTIVALAVSTLGAQGVSTFAVKVDRLLAARRAAGNAVARSGREALEHAALERVYHGGGAPLWSDGRGPTRQAIVAIAQLASAHTRGLTVSTYDVPAIREMAGLAARSDEDAARFDVALSASMIAFLADLHMGQVTPDAVRFDMPNVHDQIDLAALTTDVAQAVDVTAAITRVEPPYAGYDALQRALARYRTLAADTTVRPPRRAPGTIRPGDDYDDVPTLARLLYALRDLEASDVGADMLASRDSMTPQPYTDAVAGAVARFQHRHGLDPDSAIGPATIAQLRVPIARRVRQMELTLERWRWLPDRAPPRYVVVNIPGFRLYAFEDDSVAREPVLRMNIIVGEAQRPHNTPVFTATMREVVFRPYWDVPPRIARLELIPMFRRRPSSFGSDGYEIVRKGTGDVAAPTYPPTEANFERVLSGDLRLRQRPGPGNALGLVKFLFPNRYNVYLHDTPTQPLFQRNRRDFSHGCMRIAQPADLAELVLHGQASWDRAAIDSAMNGTRTLRVPIARPLTVFVLYATAAADENGVVRFYPDVYGHDATLERALAEAGRTSASPPPTRPRTER
jgi:murein L,D-transpeptidase YcbB/YkuD